jgi:hypothetical protein
MSLLHQDFPIEMSGYSRTDANPLIGPQPVSFKFLQEIFPLYKVSNLRKSDMQGTARQFERTVLQALRNQVPVRDLPGVRIRAVRQNPLERFDVSFELESGANRVLVFGEIKVALSPKQLRDIGPWLKRLKALRPDVAFALVSSTLSLRSQSYALENGIDFLDLDGNISINVPDTFTLRRLGIRSKKSNAASVFPATNVFSGRSSRILRVLLEKLKPRTLTEIANEMTIESERTNRIFSTQQFTFAITLGAISKAISSLDEQLWISRQGSLIAVPEPRRLLIEWAEKYKERYRWRLRNSFETSNPFGSSVGEVYAGLKPLIADPYVFTGAAAAGDAPFVDLDGLDVFLPPIDDRTLRQLNQRPQLGPRLRFIYPYDSGVFMYPNFDGSTPRASNIQTYLDLYARGGRDFKQANHLLETVIEPQWKAA